MTTDQERDEEKCHAAVYQIVIACLDARMWHRACKRMARSARCGKDDAEWFLSEAETLSSAALMRKIDDIIASTTESETALARFAEEKFGELIGLRGDDDE